MTLAFVQNHRTLTFICVAALTGLVALVIILSRTYVRLDFTQTGTASWYGPVFEGHVTSSGEIYDENDFTAAHRTLAMNSVVRVTNLENGSSVIVRINDRGPYADDRIIDLSRAAALAMGIDINDGLAQVRIVGISILN